MKEKVNNNSMQHKQLARGFTLVETIVAIGIMSIIITGFSTLINGTYKTYRYSQNKLGALNAGANALRNFENTARGATIFYENSASVVTFLAYQKGDTYPAPSKISYFFSNNLLRKSVITPVKVGSQYTYPDANKVTQTIASSLGNSNLFTYYDENNNLLNQPVQSAVIRLVQFNLTVTSGTVPESMQTTVQIRNLKTNL